MSNVEKNGIEYPADRLPYENYSSPRFPWTFFSQVAQQNQITAIVISIGSPK